MIDGTSRDQYCRVTALACNVILQHLNRQRFLNHSRRIGKDWSWPTTQSEKIGSGQPLKYFT